MKFFLFSILLIMTISPLVAQTVYEVVRVKVGHPTDKKGVWRWDPSVKTSMKFIIKEGTFLILDKTNSTYTVLGEKTVREEAGNLYHIWRARDEKGSELNVSMNYLKNATLFMVNYKNIFIIYELEYIVD